MTSKDAVGFTINENSSLTRANIWEMVERIAEAYGGGQHFYILFRGIPRYRDEAAIFPTYGSWLGELDGEAGYFVEVSPELLAAWIVAQPGGYVCRTGNRAALMKDIAAYKKNRGAGASISLSTIH